MFKLIFRTIVIIIFLVFLTIALASWKGGEPFRTIGKVTIEIGKKILDFGDFVDELRAGSKKIKKGYDEIRDVITSEEKNKTPKH